VSVVDHLDEKQTYAERHECEGEEGTQQQQTSWTAHPLA